jgi:hypothetical protein
VEEQRNLWRVIRAVRVRAIRARKAMRAIRLTGTIETTMGLGYFATAEPTAAASPDMLAAIYVAALKAIQHLQ